MKILYFDNLQYDGDYADFVKCPHCDNNGNKADAMLVPSGNEYCPMCGNQTIWASDNREKYEVLISEMFDNEEIIHTNANFYEIYNDMADEAILVPFEG